MKFNLAAVILFLACLTAIFLPNQSDASDSEILKLYDAKTIYIYYSFMGNGFVKDGQIMPFGTFGSNLAREMSGSEFALEEMQKARKYGIAGAIANTVAAGFSIAGIVMIIMDKDASRTYDIVSVITGGAFNIVAEAFNRSSRAAMNRAVWLYNRDVLIGKIHY